MDTQRATVKRHIPQLVSSVQAEVFTVLPYVLLPPIPRLPLSKQQVTATYLWSN